MQVAGFGCGIVFVHTGIVVVETRPLEGECFGALEVLGQLELELFFQHTKGHTLP